MTNDTWIVYDRLVRAKDILGNAPRFVPSQELNDVIDGAFGLLQDNLPLLAEILEDLEE